MRVSSALPILVFLPILLVAPVLAQTPKSPYDSVDPLIGTAGGGNTFPGATLPFGMVQWSPDTNTDAWYQYGEKQLYGFSLTHVSGAGCPLYGDFAVLPTLDPLTTSPAAKFIPLAFDRRDEQAHPGYYTVTLTNGVRVELTVAERAGIAKFKFPLGVRKRFLINGGSSANSIPSPNENPRDHEAFGNHIEIKPDGSFSGWTSAGRFCGSDSNYKLYIAGKFSRPFTSNAVWQDAVILKDAKSATGKHTGAWVEFSDDTEKLERLGVVGLGTGFLELKVGISFVSEASALANMEKGIPDWNFEQVHQRAQSTWSDLLNRVAVEGGTPDQQKIFYTGVYHSFLSPNIFSDEDGQYIGFDGKVYSLAGTKQKTQYANFSDWDIYRNTVQWQALFEPERESDMMQSLVNDAEQSGWYPRWPAANDVTYVMGGDSPVALLSSAYAFGARSFDTTKALEYMVKAGTQPGMGPHNDSERPFLAEYLKAGYAPADKDRIAASRTLEYASDDFAIAQFARATGRDDEYHRFLKQSENWKSLVDPETHWIRPRNADGTWLAGFDPERSLPKRPNAPVDSDQAGFEEGNTYQYSFMVPFDYPALFAAMGGEHVAEPRLDHFFTSLRCWGKPCFNIENEPDFVTPYAYVFMGKPWKTQEVVTRIAKDTFKPTPDGIPGNDDLGATSGVYVWNALGFYPAVPGVGGLVLGTPMFDKATLQLSGGRTLAIERQGQGIYVQSVTLNGAPYASSWLPIGKIHAGTNELRFTMGVEPNTKWGTEIADRPPNFRE
ncbi:GH92 family glycosyl hydrolase [Telmatobacter sp. DSM 110680]|uniref:GH92 family glycosyl hydrolase n=1 Tax=Telmatobacter sp. DSM 110680 TaxID=3036704 RepID=A0AAU7DG88_9BACT